MCWEMESRQHLPDSVPAALPQASAHSSLGSEPAPLLHAGDSKTLPTFLPSFLQNSRPFAVLLLISICTQLFPGWQCRQRARPVLCQHSAYERCETTGAFVLTAGFALPTPLSAIFQGHQSKEPSGKSLKGPWHQMAAVVPSDLQAFQELPPALHAAPGPGRNRFAFSRDPKAGSSWQLPTQEAENSENTYFS